MNTSLARGTYALVAKPSGSSTTKYLREDGSWQVPYSAATASTLGLVKIGATGLGSKQYAVQLNASNQMFVSVPWENDIYTPPTPTSTLFNFYESSGNLYLSA
jgi:hypothetical protein